jgi:hypothetical protein
VTTPTRSKFVGFFADRPWIRSANVALLGVLVFAMNVGRGGLMGAAAWVMLVLAIGNGLIAIGLLAARNERTNTPRPAGRV